MNHGQTHPEITCQLQRNSRKGVKADKDDTTGVDVILKTVSRTFVARLCCSITSPMIIQIQTFLKVLLQSNCRLLYARDKCLIDGIMGIVGYLSEKAHSWRCIKSKIVKTIIRAHD